MPEPLDLSVRPPRQRRSRERWQRVLDAGVGIIEEGNAESLTIASVCARAEVPPRFIYERVTNKEALFLAVYEHGTQRVLDDSAPFDDDQLWHDTDAEATVRLAVSSLAATFWSNRAWLRAVVLISSEHSEVLRRGAGYVGGLRTTFVTRLTDAGLDAMIAGAVFESTFSSLAFRIVYGGEFLGAPADDDEATELLCTMAVKVFGLI